jgi:TPR repeat protein
MSNRRQFLALCTLPSAVLAVAAAPASVSMADAQQAYYQGQYRRSLQMFERLAASHNAEAAEAAGFMLLHGEQLYGQQVLRNLPRAKAYLVQAARSGRAGAGFILNMIERTD